MLMNIQLLIMKNFTWCSILIVLMLTGSMPVFAVENIQLQGLFSNKAVINVDGKRHVISVGQSTPEGVKLVAVSKDKVTLEIKDKRSEHSLGGAVSTEFKQAPMVNETIYADDQGMFEAVGTINGYTVKFLVDTGATFIAMNETQAKRLGIRYRLEGEPSGASTASGLVRGYKVKLNTVSMGKIRQHYVDAMVIDGDHPGPILLGMSFLGKLKVETSGNSITLRQRR